MNWLKLFIVFMLDNNVNTLMVVKKHIAIEFKYNCFYICNKHLIFICMNKKSFQDCCRYHFMGIRKNW